MKTFEQFIDEAAQVMPPPPPAPGTAGKPAQAPPPPPPQAQKPVQAPPPQAQKPAQQGQQSGQPAPTDEKVGDLSNYNNPDVTKHPDTVKNMVAQIKDMTKDQLVALRDFIAQQKDIDDPKSVIGKL